MTTTELATLALSALAGLALGAFFFGGLWWTVRAIVGAAHSALLQVASLVLRTAGTLLGFHVAGGGDAARLLACLAGFVVARVVVARWVKASTASAPAPEHTHASRP